MKKIINPPKDTFKIRCRRLGHQIQFSYCRIENQDLPCVKTLDCWHTHFKVENYLRTQLSQTEWEQTFQQHTKPKTQTLLELIEAAKKREKEEK